MGFPNTKMWRNEITLRLLFVQKEGLFMENDYGVRTLDELWRVIIPTELRKKLGWEAGTKLSVIEKDGAVILKPASES
jgi:AbrB family looped-hinge helix DNA binding protein